MTNLQHRLSSWRANFLCELRETTSHGGASEQCVMRTARVREAPAREGDHDEEAAQIRTRGAPQRQRPRESWHREPNSIRRTRAACEAENGRHREEGRRQNREG